MYKKLLMMIALALMLLPLVTSADRPLEKLRIQLGDTPGCGSMALDDTEWAETSFFDIPQLQHFCLRTSINLNAEQAAEIQILKLSMLASSRIYWDGVLIGENGRVGQNKANEIPGLIDFAIPVPRELITAGEHQISIEASSYHLSERLSSIFYYFALENFQEASAGPLRHIVAAIFFMGSLLIASLFFQALYWIYERRIHHQILSALCLFSVLLLAAEKWRALMGYTYDQHILRLHLVVVLTFITCLLLIIFYLVYYKLKKKSLWVSMFLAALLTVALASSSYDGKSMLLFLVALLGALGINITALIGKQAGASASFIGMIIVATIFFIEPYGFLEHRFSLAAFVVVIVAFLSVVNEMKQSRAQALLTVRMEAELLRRNLQPHFLMNSLMLAIEWIEQKPAAASRFVQALAQELGMLVRFSEKKMISLDEEIDLCTTHLKIMADRYDADYSLQ
jgi:sensor histidine kinase YesM